MRYAHALVLLLLAAILSLDGVHAIGIGYRYALTGGPLDFQPEMERTFAYELITDAGSTMDYEINVRGGLAPYVDLSTNFIPNVKSSTLVPFTAHLKLPPKLESGIHEAQICVLEGRTRGGGMIGARTEACGGFTIRVLYEGKYLKIQSFEVHDVNVGEMLKMEVAVKSWSEVDINSIKGYIDIFGPTRVNQELKKIATVTTEERQLKSNAEEVLTAYLDTSGMDAGGYTAFLTLFYDGEQVNMSRRFRIGDLHMEILNYTKQFPRGRVNKLDVEVLSQWNSRIDNVYSTIDIDNERLTTPVASFSPWENKMLTAYWDTTNKKLGEYKGKITVYYPNKTTEEIATFDVVIGGDERRGMITNLIVLIIIVLLILGLILLFFKTRKLDKEEKRSRQRNK